MADGAEGSRTAAEIESAERKAKAEADLAEQNARIKRIEADKAEGLAAATTRQSVTEANVATVKALYPKGETKPLEGTTTRDDKSGFLGDLVAYQAARACVSEIASRVNVQFEKLKPGSQDPADAPGSPRILIVRDRQQLSRSLAHAQFSYQLEQFIAEVSQARERLELLFPTPAPTAPQPPAVWSPTLSIRSAAPGLGLLAGMLGTGALATGLSPAVTGLLAAGSIAGLAADAVAFLQTDYDIRGRETTIDIVALENALAGEIDALAYVDGFSLLQESPVLRLFAEAVALRDSAEAEFQFVEERFQRGKELESGIPLLQLKMIREPSQSKREEMAADIALKQAELDDLAPWLSSAERALVAWQTLRPIFDAWALSALRPTEGGVAPLHAAALVQTIQENRITHLLHLQVAASEAEGVTARHRFAFKRNGSVTHIGGATISFILAQVNGIVVLADTVTRARQLKHHYWHNKNEAAAVADEWFSRPPRDRKWTLPD